MVVSCAWCSELSSDGEVWFRPSPWRLLFRGRDDESRLTHGICPRCFARLAPGVAYPARGD